MDFELVAPYQPTGDQPQAIEKLVTGAKNGMKKQTLLGVTGSGKTFTMANIIAKLNRPTLVLAHNKTLAAQLCSEFKEFFPKNAVEYFVSYYDYYQPEAYIPGKDTYIEKDALVNEEIDKLRHSATSALFERRDVIIVASVSCIYSLGDPSEYEKLTLGIRVNSKMDRADLLRRLVEISYDRNDIDLTRNHFRVRGDVVEIYPSNSDRSRILRVEFFGDEIDRICEIDSVTGEVTHQLNYAVVFPATHYAVSAEKRAAALQNIIDEMQTRVEHFKENNQLIEAQRIEERTRYDLEMMREIGYCSGIENYSRVLSGRPQGSVPYTLLDYFPSDFLLFVDESHIMLPQVRGMSGGDASRKQNLIEYGFRLPSAADNRPLTFDEFESKCNQTIYVSATPATYERQNSEQIVEQLIRPTGLVDPLVEVRAVEGQINDLMGEILTRAERNERVLVTTLTKKMAEDLTEFFELNDIRVKYIHFNVDTIERMEIIRDLRLGEFDCLVGINLLREGLDIPEVSLVAILDADKQGLLRNETSLIQTIGRAARNVDGKVIMYAETLTDSMRVAIGETNRRRKIQSEYNEKHGIIPKSVSKPVRDIIDLGSSKPTDKPLKKMTAKEKDAYIDTLTANMLEAAKNLQFELAAKIRDKINTLRTTK